MNIKKLNLVSCIVVLSTLGVGFGIFHFLRLDENFDPYSYLPENTKIATIKPEIKKSFGEKGVQDAVIFNDIDNDNKREVVIFYTLPRKIYGEDWANVLVLEEQDEGYKKLWEDKRSVAISINPLSGVWDINKDEKPEIVAARWVGASFGGYLDIFQWDGSKFVKLNGGWNLKNDIRAIELEDVDRDGVVEIIILHRFSYPDVYKWEKDKYSLYKEGRPYPAYK